MHAKQGDLHACVQDGPVNPSGGTQVLRCGVSESSVWVGGRRQECPRLDAAAQRGEQARWWYRRQRV